MGHITDLELGPDGQPLIPTDEQMHSQSLAYDAHDEEDESVSLCEVLDRVLNKGVVLRGDIVITVADIELLYLGMELILCSVDLARKSGVRLPRDMAQPTMLGPRR